MKYPYSFEIKDELNENQIYIKISDSSVSGFDEVINSIRDESYKEWFINKINTVLDSGNADTISGELSGVYSEKTYSYFFDNLNQKIMRELQIETAELKKLIEVWWDEYKKFEIKKGKKGLHTYLKVPKK